MLYYNSAKPNESELQIERSSAPCYTVPNVQEGTMTEIIVYNNVNAIVEALLYFKNLASGESVAAFAQGMKEKYPESIEEISELFTPIIELERRLNSVTDGIDMERVHFFFDLLGDAKTMIRGINLANAIMLPNRLDDMCTSDFRTFVDGLKALNVGERINRLRFSVLLTNEGVNPNEETDAVSYFDQVAALPSTEENKMKLLLTARHFADYAEELYGVMAPVVELIEEQRALYQPLLDRFAQIHGGIDQDGLIGLVSNFRSFNFDTPNIDVYNLCPRMFNITGIVAMILPRSDGRMVYRFEMHVLVDRILAYRNRDMSLKGIAECVKALGNPTRLEIMSMLRSEEVHAQGLVEKLGLSFTAVSSHMTKLMLAGLVIGERRGNFVYYHASIEGIRWLIEKLRALLPEG